MWFRLYTAIVVIAYYPIYLSLLAADKIQQKLDK
jgi:hypothetical protein